MRFKTVGLDVLFHAFRGITLKSAFIYCSRYSFDDNQEMLVGDRIDLSLSFEAGAKKRIELHNSQMYLYSPRLSIYNSLTTSLFFSDLKFRPSKLFEHSVPTSICISDVPSIYEAQRTGKKVDDGRFTLQNCKHRHIKVQILM